ncbi:MAG: flagellar basal body rod protein FlgC [Planctomycetota bacterium]
MSIFDIAGTGLFAERIRMDLISHNLANMNTTRDKFGNINPYRRKEVIFRELISSDNKLNGVMVEKIVDDMSEFRKVYNPEHPDSNKDGYVLLPNINPIVEMGNFINSSRTYQFHLTMIENAKTMYINTLRLLG